MAKVALVTGAAAGLGFESAKALAGLGYTVIGVDVQDERGKKAFADLGRPHHYRNLDVRDPAKWKAMIADVVKEFGALTLIHLNAGVMSRPPGAPLFDNVFKWFTNDNCRKVMSVNFDGVAYGIIAAQDAPGLEHIIITSSGGGVYPLPADPYYTASKHAVIGLARALEPALKEKGIRIDVLCPGAIDTDMTAPDIRAALPQEPPSFIGDCVKKLVAERPDGLIWMAWNRKQGLTRYDPPSLDALAMVEKG